ncbi:MAG: glycerol-3-phosphate 1-O-acyltransferase PlsY [Candidatus Omnitrophota bacterium]
MSLLLKILISCVVSYLIGSIPTAYLFGRIYKGIDIRKHGSGNVGATNTFRVLGKGPGIIVLLVDVLKGAIATAVIADAFGIHQVSAYIVSGLCAVAGHNWTIFLNFKGGKGIATSLGVLIGLTIKIVSIRPVLLLTVLFWLITFLFSGYVSLASLVAAAGLPLLMVITHQTIEIVVLGAIFCFLVVLRHRSNIKRLLAGQEARFNTPFNKRK